MMVISKTTVKNYLLVTGIIAKIDVTLKQTLLRETKCSPKGVWERKWELFSKFKRECHEIAALVYAE